MCEPKMSPPQNNRKLFVMIKFLKIKKKANSNVVETSGAFSSKLELVCISQIYKRNFSLELWVSVQIIIMYVYLN